MSSAGGMTSHTASAIAAKTIAVSHDLVISGYSTTKDCYTSGMYIKSAKFVAGGRRWYLRYYPHGCCAWDKGSVTFLLYHDRDSDEDKVATYYRISLLDTDGNPVPRSYNSNHYLSYVEPSRDETNGFIGRGVLEKSAYLKDDAFSVRCEFSVPVIVTENVLQENKANQETQPSSPTRTHLEGLVRFISDDVPTDVSLEVGDETFQAHKRFLAAQSPVFKALFVGPMRENTTPSLRIHDIEPRVFKAMLGFIYRANLLPPPVDADEGDDPMAMTQHLLMAADRYNLERLKSICAEKLRRHINTTTVGTTLELALRHSCHALKDACYDFLAPHRGNLKTILNGEGFEQLVNDFPLVVVELLDRVAPSPLRLQT